ncbi:MAG: methyltransferase domain-containing protein [Burkholderiales bacterium]|nr:MAG: methyltransferase domain-containing protein [Burkholderiales bacterium]
MAGPNREFWEQRFESRHTPWDRGAASPQLELWLASGVLAPCRILVPGCGSGYEVEALARAGFEVTGLDYAAAAVNRTRARLEASGLAAQVVQADALQWQPAAPVDAVYEQTCLCALYPDQWTQYAAQLHQWLSPGGQLFALFMQAPRAGAAQGLIEGPPYHCDINAMRALLDAAHWDWPRPPYDRVPHPAGIAELAVILTRRQ